MSERAHLVTTLESYQLRLPSFEGPLDLLLRLIEREQLPISDVSLLAVFDQFMEFARQLGESKSGGVGGVCGRRRSSLSVEISCSSARARLGPRTMKKILIWYANLKSIEFSSRLPPHSRRASYAMRPRLNVATACRLHLRIDCA